MASNSSKAEHLPSCPICLHIYDEVVHQPKFLRCHHRVCQLCCYSLIELNSIKCPVCRIFTHTEFDSDVEVYLRTDHELLAIMSIAIANSKGNAAPLPTTGGSIERIQSRMSLVSPAPNIRSSTSESFQNKGTITGEDLVHPPRLESEVFGSTSTSVVDEISLHFSNYLHETTTGNSDGKGLSNGETSSQVVRNKDTQPVAHTNSLLNTDNSARDGILALSSISATSSSSDSDLAEFSRQHRGSSLHKASSSKSKKGKSWKKPTPHSHKSKKINRRQKGEESSTSSMSSPEDQSIDSLSSDSDFKTDTMKRKKSNLSKKGGGIGGFKSKFYSVQDELASLMRKSSGKSTGTRPKVKKSGAEEKYFVKDLFLTSVSDLLELPSTTENQSLEKAGLGMRFDIAFKVNKSPAYVSRILNRAFPRLGDLDFFYICTKSAGVGRRVSIQHYSVPCSQELKRLNGKLIILVPVKKSLPYELAEEMTVHCDHCNLDVHIRMWANHLQRECQSPSEGNNQRLRSSNRKAY